MLNFPSLLYGLGSDSTFLPISRLLLWIRSEETWLWNRVWRVQTRVIQSLFTRVHTWPVQIVGLIMPGRGWMTDSFCWIQTLDTRLDAPWDVSRVLSNNLSTLSWWQVTIIRDISGIGFLFFFKKNSCKLNLRFGAEELVLQSGNFFSNIC